MFIVNNDGILKTIVNKSFLASATGTRVPVAIAIFIGNILQYGIITGL